MNKFWLTAAGVCAVSLCIAKVPSTAPHKTLAMHSTDSALTVCHLGNDCLNVSKIAPKACRVAKDSKSLDGCAVDGMKLINKFQTGGKQRA